MEWSLDEQDTGRKEYNMAANVHRNHSAKILNDVPGVRCVAKKMIKLVKNLSILRQTKTKKPVPVLLVWEPRAANSALLELAC